MLQLLKHLLFFLLVLILPFCSSVIYSSTVSQGKEMEFQKESKDLVSYLNTTLIEAGVPEDSRKYLIDISRTELSNVDEKDIPEKKELLRKNLYILLIDLAAKKPLLLKESKMDFSSRGYELTAAHMSFLKSNQVFNELKINDIKIIFKTLCPIWPFC